MSFRTADSLPAYRVDELRREREIWLRFHPPPWSDGDYDEYCRFTFHKLDRWLDNHLGACPLRRTELSQIVVDALLEFDGSRYFLDDTTVMPNHAHTLFKPIGGCRLRQSLHSWKSYTATRINRELGASGQFWFHESFDRLVRDWEELERTRSYIRQNPLRAGLAEAEFALFKGIGVVKE